MEAHDVQRVRHAALRVDIVLRRGIAMSPAAGSAVRDEDEQGGLPRLGGGGEDCGVRRAAVSRRGATARDSRRGRSVDRHARSKG